MRSIVRRIFACALLASLAFPLFAQQADASSPATLSEQMLLEADSAGRQALLMNAAFDHYDDDGYPESPNGRLVLESHPDGPVVTMEGDPDPYLLYAQYVNRQRDAVLLARTGGIDDPLPSGSAVAIPYGYGAVRFNTAYVSIVESLLIPHFSDNQKEYVQFPLTDLYVGGGFSLSGIAATLRYVHTESWVGYVSAGLNTFPSSDPANVRSRYLVPVSMGGGIRFPGLFPEMLGENSWTVGADLMVGVGDPDPGDAVAAGAIVPSVFLDIERVLFDEAGLRRDYRSDPRPYNYHVNALVLRVGLALNVTNSGGGSLFVPSLGLSYQYNVLGPAIPDHTFKETEVLYVSEVYREDLREQERRREERASR